MQITKSGSNTNITLDLGGGSLGSTGGNSIYNNTAFAIYNTVSGVASKRKTTGGEYQPISRLFNGTVDYDPWLLSNPTKKLATFTPRYTISFDERNKSILILLSVCFFADCLC